MRYEDVEEDKIFIGSRVNTREEVEKEDGLHSGEGASSREDLSSMVALAFCTE